VAIAVGQAHLFGWTNTVVSALVPLTVMVTTTATLVYLHSRFMEPDDAPTLIEHHARALANKFLPSTASMFATAVGFAALAVSDIRPVREMGIWTACGLIIAWVGCFTLFPALQSLLRTPLRKERAVGRQTVSALRRIPGPRHPALSLGVRGRRPGADALRGGALFGIPGKLAPWSSRPTP
jgi:predicted RND superfamily exporter protein